MPRLQAIRVFEAITSTRNTVGLIFLVLRRRAVQPGRICALREAEFGQHRRIVGDAILVLVELQRTQPVVELAELLVLLSRVVAIRGGGPCK